jgi:hypothetical protein
MNNTVLILELLPGRRKSGLVRRTAQQVDERVALPVS